MDQINFKFYLQKKYNKKIASDNVCRCKKIEYIIKVDLDEINETNIDVYINKIKKCNSLTSKNNKYLYNNYIYSLRKYVAYKKLF